MAAGGTGGGSSSGGGSGSNGSSSSSSSLVSDRLASDGGGRRARSRSRVSFDANEPEVRFFVASPLRRRSSSGGAGKTRWGSEKGDVRGGTLGKDAAEQTRGPANKSQRTDKRGW